MPCVFRNGRIIRCAEGNCVSHCVQKTILHPVLIGIVYEHVEGLAGGLHVHACQSHSSPRLIAESPFVDPPAVDGRQAIDDASTDCEFRVGGQFRETNRGYGKLADWVCDGSGALLATARRTEVSNSDDTVRLNNQHSRGLTVGHAAHAVDFNRRPILSRQNVLALFRIPTASTNRAAELHEYQRSGFNDGEPFAVVQGYGKLFRHPTAVRRGVGGFRVAKHLHLPVTLDKQAETAGWKRDDAHVGERTERFWDGLIRRRVVLLSTAGELDVAVDRDDATDATQSEVVVRIRRLPLLGYGMLLKMDFHDSTCDSNFRTNEQIDCPIRCNRYLDRTLQV